MASTRHVIYEKYLFKLSGSEEKRKALKVKRNSWKQKYFVVYYENDALVLSWHDKMPADASADPKGKMSLWPAYRITKIDVDKHACEIMTQINRICVSSNDQNVIDDFVFYLQTQTSLKENLEGQSYSVFPENSSDHRRLGCIGNVCVLHVSPFGVSLILQHNRALIAQWPLRCIRTFECSAKGNFTFEAGRHAPFGPGLYEFQTRRGQDQDMYQLLDHYVVQASSLSHNNLAANSTPDIFEEIIEEYNRLKRLTIINLPAAYCSSEERQRQTRNSGQYDHIYQRQAEDDSVPEWLTSLEKKEIQSVLSSVSMNTEPDPPALPPRPPLGRRHSNQSDGSVNSVTMRNQSGDAGNAQVQYEDLANEAVGNVAEVIPPLPPRNPKKRQSTPPSAEQLDQSTDANRKDFNNYQDIDEVLDSLPPAPPPPNFLPPTPPPPNFLPPTPPPQPVPPTFTPPLRNKDQVSSVWGRRPPEPPPFNNYEEIPHTEPYEDISHYYSKTKDSRQVINAYEELDQLVPLVQNATTPAKPKLKFDSHPHSVNKVFEEDLYFTIEGGPGIESLPPSNNAAINGSRDSPVNSKNSRDSPVNSKNSRDSPVNSKNSRDSPVNSKNSSDLPIKPPLAAKPSIAPKPAVAPKPNIGLFGRKNSLEAKPESSQLPPAPNPRRNNSTSKLNSMYEVEVDKPRLAKKLSLPGQSEDSYMVFPIMVPDSGPVLRPPLTAVPPPSTLRRALSEEYLAMNSGPADDKPKPSAADDYLSIALSLPDTPRLRNPIVRRSPSPRPQSETTYMPMKRDTPSPPRALQSSYGRSSPSLQSDQTYMDMNRSLNMDKSAPRKDEQDLYFDMSGISVVVQSESDDVKVTPSPFDPMNISAFEKMSRSTDAIDFTDDDFDDDDDDENSSRLTVPRFQRSVSNPSLVVNTSHKSKLTAFLYGTLRKKGKKKKTRDERSMSPPESKTPVQNEDPTSKGDAKFTKNKSYRSGRKHKKITTPNKDIQLAANARSFVKLQPPTQTKRATYGGGLDERGVEMRDYSQGQSERPGPQYETQSLGRRRFKHAVSTPNLL